LKSMLEFTASSFRTKNRIGPVAVAKTLNGICYDGCH
jgi:hypothetical protein